MRVFLLKRKASLLNSLTRTPTSFTFIAFTLANLLIGSSFTIFLTFSGNLLSTNSNAVLRSLSSICGSLVLQFPVLLTINSADVNVVVITSLCFFFFFFCSSSSMPGGNGGGLMLFPGESATRTADKYASDALIFVDFSPPWRLVFSHHPSLLFSVLLLCLP